ncbi:MAG: alpha/beta hydrolase [Gemmatimonadaceae bacterium]
MPLRPTLIAVVVAIAGSSGASAQTDDPVLDSLVGLFQDARGSVVVIWRPAPGQVAVGFQGGEVRGLAGSRGTYSYGPSLGITTPSAGEVSRLGAGLDSIVWTPRDSAPSVLARVALRETDVAWSNGRVRLAGTIIMPPGPGPFTTIVMLHGAGAETRESSRVIAYYLAAHGVASLIYDKRSTGASTGDSFNVPFADLARDALGGVALLRRSAGVHPDRIGMFGPSQGSWIALAATQLDTSVAFLVLQSGDATTPLEQEMYRIPSILRSERARGVARSASLTDADIAELEAFRRLKFQFGMTGKAPDGWDRALATARRASWFALTGDGLPPRDFWAPNGTFDPMPALLAYRDPVLAVFGGRDVSKDVPRNATLMREAFARSENHHASVLVIDDANHGLFETKTGRPLEVELPSLTRIAPGYLEAVAAFLAQLGHLR